jgi:hypothetical protein
MSIARSPSAVGRRGAGRGRHGRSAATAAMRIMIRLLAGVAVAAALLVLPVPAQASAPPATIVGLDLHDGMVLRHNGLYYLYGTRYGCGFRWGTHGTPFCGFGVATSRYLNGPWKYRQLLFSPAALDNWGGDKGRTWNWVCGSTGAGCFNPRMLLRPDGVWVLWFNAVKDWWSYHVPAYYAMGCNGPLGPCGYQAGRPHGSTHKPKLVICNDNGDFSILTSGASAAIVCSLRGLSEEQLSKWWADGTGVGTRNLAGLARPMTATAMLPLGEGEGGFLRSDGTWELTYSLPGCGYCTGPPALKSAAGPTEVQAGYATAPNMLGPWTAQGVLSPAYCTGQPRTAMVLLARPYEWIDRWTGSANETTAAIRLQPMAARPWSCT